MPFIGWKLKRMLYKGGAAYRPREFEQLTQALEIELTQAELEWKGLRARCSELRSAAARN